jgi:ketosteroid isomerase-like protein
VTARVEPDDAMMAPVRAVADFMRTPDAAPIADVFADDVVIVENFAPYIFRGPSAAARWQAGFREHAATLSDLRNRFGEAQDFSRTGDTVYFVLPTTWTGQTRGKPFVEEGGWAFVLERRGEGWRIASYAWAVTAFRLV